MFFKNGLFREFPGGPVVRTLFTAEVVGSIPGWGTKFQQAAQLNQ